MGILIFFDILMDRQKSGSITKKLSWIHSALQVMIRVISASEINFLFTEAWLIRVTWSLQQVLELLQPGP
jgi:hypothetical protein